MRPQQINVINNKNVRYQNLLGGGGEVVVPLFKNPSIRKLDELGIAAVGVALLNRLAKLLLTKLVEAG